MSWKLKFWGLNFLLQLLQSFFVPLFRGVPLVLRWYSVGIMKCPACVLGNVQLFRHCSGVFRCSAGVLCLFALCSRVPGFIVCPKNIVSLLMTFYMFSNNSVFIKVKLEPIFVSLNRISRELRCYNILTIVRKNPLAFSNSFAARTYSNGILSCLHKHWSRYTLKMELTQKD